MSAKLHRAPERLPRSTGGYTSVDPRAALNLNRTVIEKLKKTVQRATRPFTNTRHMPTQ